MVRQSRSVKMLSRARPRPSMLDGAPLRVVSRARYSWLVNWVTLIAVPDCGRRPRARARLAAAKRALTTATPTIWNSDQGSQFTSQEYLALLTTAEVRISMDGRGRALDNIFTERLWRTIKYEEVYLHSYESPREARQALTAYIRFYNTERLHQSWPIDHRRNCTLLTRCCMEDQHRHQFWPRRQAAQSRKVPAYG